MSDHRIGYLQKIIFILLIFSVRLSADVVVLKAERMLDVESGKIVSPAIVVVDGDKIRSVNSGQIPDNATVIDFGKDRKSVV